MLVLGGFVYYSSFFCLSLVNVIFHVCYILQLKVFRNGIIQKIKKKSACPASVIVCACVSHSACPTLCDPMDCSPPGSSVHGILQAQTLEWVAISFSNDLPNPGIKPRSPSVQTDSVPLSHLGSYRITLLLLLLLSRFSCVRLHATP